MEATQWVAGLSNFYWALSRASEEKIPDKNMLMRQLERQVDKLAGEFDRASDRPTDLIKEVSSKATRQAKIDPRIVEQLETRMREKLDHATGELVPGESPYGVFTGLVANKLLGFTQDPTLSQTGEELGKSIQSGLLVPEEPSSLDELAAVPAPGKELAPRPSDPGTDDLTPIDLDEIDTADTRGALRRFDPALLEQTPSRALEASRGPAEDGPVASRTTWPARRPASRTRTRSWPRSSRCRNQSRNRRPRSTGRRRFRLRRLRRRGSRTSTTWSSGREAQRRTREEGPPHVGTTRGQRPGRPPR